MVLWTPQTLKVRMLDRSFWQSMRAGFYGTVQVLKQCWT